MSDPFLFCERTPPTQLHPLTDHHNTYKELSGGICDASILISAIAYDNALMIELVCLDHIKANGLSYLYELQL